MKRISALLVGITFDSSFERAMDWSEKILVKSQTCWRHFYHDQRVSSVVVLLKGGHEPIQSGFVQRLGSPSQIRRFHTPSNVGHCGTIFPDLRHFAHLFLLPDKGYRDCALRKQ